MPWRKLKEKDEIMKMKIEYNNEKLVQDLPEEMNQFMRHLNSLEYGDRPNYRFLQSLMENLFHCSYGGEDTIFGEIPFDG